MPTIRWRDEARSDLRQIITFIAEHDPFAAERLKTLIEFSAERLVSYPNMYRAGRVPDTREAVVHPNYILVYRVGDSVIEILNVIHTRRQYPTGDAG